MHDIFYTYVLPVIGIISLYLFIWLIIHIINIYFTIPLHRLNKYRIQKTYSEYNSKTYFIYVQRRNLVFLHYVDIKDKSLFHNFEDAAEWIRVKKIKDEIEYKSKKNKKKTEYFPYVDTTD